MLSLLCRSPDVVDSPFYETQSQRSRTRRSIRGVSFPGLSRTSSGSKKKRTLKGSIGAPTDFKHEAHVGVDNMMMMAPTGAWDMDQWKAELEKHMQVQPVVVQSMEQPSAVPSVTNTASPSPMASPASSVIVPRRKPVPSLLPPPHEAPLIDDSPLSSVASSPTRETLLDDASPSVVLV